MDSEWTKKLRARDASLRWAKLDQETWSRDIEAAIEASLPAWIVTGKTVPPASATAPNVAEAASPAAPSPAATKTQKSHAATSTVRATAAAAQKPRPAVAARCKVGVETVKGKSVCSSKVVSMDVKVVEGSRHAGSDPRSAAAAIVAGSGGAASSVREAGKARSRHVSGVKRSEGLWLPAAVGSA
ncbi:unnamed protein product [Closterium sp. Naga37s-1]|nr:unnamed protein product [Closterium sp. Naga37s-1]